MSPSHPDRRYHYPTDHPSVRLDHGRGEVFPNDFRKVYGLRRCGTSVGYRRIWDRDANIKSRSSLCVMCLIVTSTVYLHTCFTLGLLPETLFRTTYSYSKGPVTPPFLSVP